MGGKGSNTKGVIGEILILENQYFPLTSSLSGIPTVQAGSSVCWSAPFKLDFKNLSKLSRLGGV